MSKRCSSVRCVYLAGSEVPVELRRGHDDTGVPGLEQRPGAPQEEPVVRVHLVDRALGLRVRLLLLLLIFAVLVELLLLLALHLRHTEVGVGELGASVPGAGVCMTATKRKA